MSTTTTDKEIISLFKDGFSNTLEDPDLQSQIQHVKGKLFDRNYLEAFNSRTNLNAYVVRWTPSRALAYADLITWLRPVYERLVLGKAGRGGQNESQSGDQELEQSSTSGHSNILCIGGGAGAEIVAFASVVLLNDVNADCTANITAIDIGPWTEVVEQLSSIIDDRWVPWNASKRKHLSGNSSNTDSASASASAAGAPAKPLEIQFIHQDILTYTADNLASYDIITSMFTTNELFAESKAGTVKFLQSLNSQCKPKTLLVIVESAGSYSEIKIGSKTFPVQFLIHHTLTSNGAWELIESNDSRWYRINGAIKYPLKLENMRYFVRLYQKN